MLVRGRKRRRWGSVVVAILALGAPASAGAIERPNLALARSVFQSLPWRDRNEIFVELMATGDFHAMASDQVGARVYDATAAFQEQHGLEPSGVLTPDTRAALSDTGGGIFNSWGFEFEDNPVAPAALVVPRNPKFGLKGTVTPHGLAWENGNRTMSLDFSFFADAEANLGIVFDRLTRPAPRKHIEYKVIRPTFFVVSGDVDGRQTYSRYIAVAGGIAGFTLSWNVASYPNGDRIAEVMANGLYPHPMVADEGRRRDMFDDFPVEPAPGASPGALVAGDDTPIAPGPPAFDAAAARERAEALRKAEQDRVAALEAERLAKQAESDRRTKADRDAKQAAAAEQRRDRLVRATDAGRTALTHADGFVKANRADPRIFDHIQRMTDLNVALRGTEAETIERDTAELKAGLASDPVYAAHEAQAAADRRRDAAFYLGEALKTLKVQKTVLRDALADNAMSPQAAAFLGFLKRIDATLAAPDLDRAQTLMGTVTQAIDAAGLHETYAAAKADAERAERADNAPRPPVLAGTPAP